MHSLYIPLKGGKYDGKKILDVKVKITEDDRVQIVDADRKVHEVYLIDENGEGKVVKNPRSKQQTGGLHLVFITDLKS